MEKYSGDYVCRFFSDGRDESKVLYILGNGFDLAHRLRTSYSDFQEFCSFRSELERICPLEPNWSNFEEALGEIEPDQAYDQATSHLPPFDYEFREVYQREDAVDNEVLTPLRELREELLRWLRSISLSGVGREFRLSSNSLYLTFNYTYLLEEVYGVSANRVLHIHGALMDEGDIVVGHNNRCVSLGSSLEEGAWPFVVDACDSIFKIVNQYYKNVDLIIKANEPFWKSLVEIEEIVVFGHSYNEIDREYFHVVSENAPSAKWIMHTYTSDDRSRAEGLAIALGLEESRYEIFNVS